MSGATLLAAAITAGAAILAYLIIAPIVRRDDCSADILVSGRNYDVSAATKALDLKAKASPAAIEVVSERLEFYANQTAFLCREYRAGRRSRAEYKAGTDQAAQFFMKAYEATAAGALAKISPEDKDELTQLVTESAPNASAADERLAQVTLVNSEGHILPSGASVRNGDQLAFKLHLSQTRYLYILGVGSGGALYRIYPAESSSNANPVAGDLTVPPVGFISVGGQPGRELVYIFVSTKPDPKIEQVAEISSHAPQQQQQQQAAVRLRDVVELRDLFAPRAATAKPRPRAAQPQPIDVTGRFGRASVTIELNHVE